MTVSEQKQAQRRAGRTARRALSAQARAAANAALCANLWQLDAVQNAQTILLYAAFGSEADLSAFVEKAQAQRQNAGLSGVRRGVFPYRRCARPGRLGGGDSTASAPPS